MSEKRRLHILWTNADVETSILMVMMYAKNSLARGWWDEVTVIVWGATAKLVAEDESVREHIRIAQGAGVAFSACVSCARQLGVISALEKMDVEVIPWGEPLTRIIQGREPLLSV